MKIYKTKIKPINFISAVADIRLVQTSAFIKGEKISGILDGEVFKLEIFDDYVEFSQVGEKTVDDDMLARLVDDIFDFKITGYAKKYVLGVEFYTSDNYKCYLQVDEKKPIDKLYSLIEESTPALSKRGLEFLDSLFEDEDDIDTEAKPEVIEATEANDSNKSEILDYFNKIKQNKIDELNRSVQKSKKDISNYDRQIGDLTNKLNEEKNNLKLLNKRLDNLGIVVEKLNIFFDISESQKRLDAEIDDNSKKLIDKISKLLKIDSDKLTQYLTADYFIIKFEGDLSKELLERINEIEGKFTILDKEQLEYTGELNWHQLIEELQKIGFQKK
jgi:hypothetical protein